MKILPYQALSAIAACIATLVLTVAASASITPLAIVGTAA